MKPPHGKRPTGSGSSSGRPPSNRPPSNRAPNAGGGASHRSGPGPGGGQQDDRGAQSQAPRPSGPRPSGPRSLSQGKPAHGSTLHVNGPRANAPNPADSRASVPHDDAPKNGPHRNGPSRFGSTRPGPSKNGPPRNGPPRNGPSRNATDKPAWQKSSAPNRSRPPHEAPEPTRGAYIDGQRVEPQARGPDTPKGAVWLYGHHAIAAALANPRRRLRRLMLTDDAEAALTQLIPPPWALQAERTERPRIDQLLGRDIAHQGAALLADTLAQPGLAEVLERPGPIVVLDQVTDPRNVGAIMRSAAAFGAAAVITQDRNAPEETGSLAKAASGTLETLPLLRAVNIARTLIALKAANVWCVGLDASGKPLSGAFFAGRRVALVLGAEGDGMRRLTRETCDEVAGLPIKGTVESLNVSAAAAVALYELTRPT